MKLSLRTLLIWVAFAAIVAAALARPSLLWTRLLFTVAIVFLGWSIVGAIATRGNRRIFWAGSAVFAAGYFFLLWGGPRSGYGDGSFGPARTLATQEVLNWIGKG